MNRENVLRYTLAAIGAVLSVVVMGICVWNLIWGWQVFPKKEGVVLFFTHLFLPPEDNNLTLYK